MATLAEIEARLLTGGVNRRVRPNDLIDLIRALGDAPANAATVSTAPTGDAPDWSQILNKPSTFAPGTHDHDSRYYTETETNTLLSGKVASDDARLSDARTPTAHTHTIANTTGLQAALDGKQAAGSYAAAVHAHAIADVTSLQAALDAKAAAADLTAHAAAADPHTGYQRETEKGAANGYAGLGADSKVPLAQLPTITASLPDMVVTRNTVAADTTLAAGYAAYVPEELEIAATFYLELASTAVLEVG